MINEPEDFLGIDDWRERKMREKGLYEEKTCYSCLAIAALVITLGWVLWWTR